MTWEHGSFRCGINNVDSSTMITYIINLETSTARMNHMSEIMSDYGFINYAFISAVNGREMSEEERQAAFDYNRSFRRYGREIGPGEVGCALSHRKCYQSLLDSDNQYALVLEDDITIVGDISVLKEKYVTETLNTEKPTIIFLSGDYWRLNSGNLVRVYDANGAYAYLINKAAARVILSSGKPFSVADDWRVVKKLGVRYYAVYPYCVDANMEMEKYSSDVMQKAWGNNKSHMSIDNLIDSVKCGIIERILAKIGLFESKIRVIDNKIVEK